MPEGVQIHSLTTNRLLYDRANAAGSPTLAANGGDSANRTATWVPMVDQPSPAKANRRACIERLKRMARYRCVIPLKRSRHPPDYVARSVSAGLFWAMTPTISVQMACVLLHWLAVRKLQRWEFNVIHAMAWTWVTNFATMFPVYYAFYVTGQVLLGNWSDLTGYSGFLQAWPDLGVPESSNSDVNLLVLIWNYVFSFLELVWKYVVIVMKTWGLPLLVGCIPYAIVGAWLGYAWSMRIVVNHRRSVLDRRLHRHDRQAASDTRGDA
jgi:hypothetical protein